MLTLIAMIALTVAALFVIGQSVPAGRGQYTGPIASIGMGFSALLGLGASMRPVEHLRS
jgi:hypothetical protein